MLSVLFFTCLYVTVTDLKNSVIQNKVIVISGIAAVFLNFIYFTFFAGEFFVAYCVNVGVMAFISIAFYAVHIWAAGDSKLLILAIMLIPTRLYYEGNLVSATVVIVIMIFSFAYIFTVLESIWLGIKEKNLFATGKIGANIKEMILQYIKCTCMVMLFDFLFGCVLPEFYSQNIEVVMIMNMLVVFLGYSIKFFDKPLPLLILVIPTVILKVFAYGFESNINLGMFAIVAVVVLLRIISEKYNYKSIPTRDVKRGMVLSYTTVLNFIPSKIKGLPTSTTEDIRSRITEDEAENIKRWEKSKYGQENIIIVRKIPFAIFISLGTIVYVIMRLILI